MVYIYIWWCSIDILVLLIIIVIGKLHSRIKAKQQIAVHSIPLRTCKYRYRKLTLTLVAAFAAA